MLERMHWQETSVKCEYQQVMHGNTIVTQDAEDFRLPLIALSHKLISVVRSFNCTVIVFHQVLYFAFKKLHY